MIRNLSVNQLLVSDLLVKEPVDSINKKLTTDTEGKKIILTSGRGSGKSVILGRRELNSLRTKDPAILVRFEAAGMFGPNEKKHFNNGFMEHYYEVIFSRKFLNYIKKYYPEFYGPYFTKEDTITSERISEVEQYINNVGYKDVNIGKKLVSGEALSDLVSVFKSITAADSVTLMIDRFDWTHNSDPRVQNILKNYFDMFDKVIITSDDSTIMEKKRLADLCKKGYDVVDFGYSTDPAVIRQIVEARVGLDKHMGNKRFPVEEISVDDYQRLVDRCDGNIKTILDTIGEAEIVHAWTREGFDMSDTIDTTCTDKLDGFKQLRKMSQPQRLYL